MVLAWSWLAAPYALVAAALGAVAVACALTRGDRVLRTAALGAVAATLPWAVTSAVAACATSPDDVERLLRLGNGPLALVGVNILLVLLAVSGQLERFRWLARIAGALGVLSMVGCWATAWVVRGTHLTPSGLRYVTGGPLLLLHVGQIGMWTAVGLFIARRANPGDHRARQLRLIAAIFVLAIVSASDALLAYDVAGYYPLAPLPTLAAVGITLDLILRADLLRSRGLDRGVAVELVAFALVAGGVAWCARALVGSSALLRAAVPGVAWAAVSGVAWAVARRLPIAARERPALDAFLAEASEPADEAALAARLDALWRATVDLGPTTLWRRGAGGLEAVAGPAAAPGGPRSLDGGGAWAVPPAVARWLVEHPEPLTTGELATLRLGALRAPLVELAQAHGAPLLVPLVDRGELVGLAACARRPGRVLREDERGLVVEAARAAARGLTSLALARAAARAGEAAREVEVAAAMRTAAARRDDALGGWAAAAEYRPGRQTSGAAWSVRPLPGGRVALLVVESEARGVAAALSTAALVGAFAAATTGDLDLDGLVAALRGSVAVARGAEPIAAFAALLDDAAGEVGWACAGHPGAVLVGGDAPRALAGRGAPLGVAGGEVARGRAALPAGHALIVGSPGVRRPHGEGWPALAGQLAGAAGARLALALVERAASARATRALPDEDLLAVVLRPRPAG